MLAKTVNKISIMRPQPISYFSLINLICLSLQLTCFGIESLVLDCSSTKGSVAGYSMSGSNVTEQVLAVGAAQFSLGPNGHYIFQGNDKLWHAGRIGDTNYTRLISNEVSKKAERAAISGDGTMIAWISEPPAKLIQVTSDHRSHSEEKFSFLANGIVGGFAWSPTESRIVFYFWSPAENGYEVYSAEYALNQMKLERIAPPSRPTRLSMERPDNPLWSHDGRFLLVEAAYGSNGINGPFTVINLDSKQCIPSVGGSWASDSKTIRHIQYTGAADARSQLAVLATEVSTGRTETNSLSSSVPDKLWVMKPSPSGRMVAFTANGSAAVLIVDSGRIIKLSDADIHSKLHWSSQ